jgi:predicted phage tail component-like protein
MIIEQLNGTRYDIKNHSLKRLYHRIPSPSVEHTTSTVEGRSGDVFLNTRFSGRTISVELLYIARDIYDYYLLRDELNGLFARNEAFYIIFKTEPYKRWKVRLAQGFSMEPSGNMRSFTIEFVCENIFAESVGTSLDLQNQKEWDIGLWGWGMGLDWDKEYQYEFNDNSFTVENIGNVAIDPCEHELEIIVKGEFSDGVTITNQTTGDVYKYNEPLSSTDNLALSGIRTLKNGTSDFKSTNKKLLTLAPGENSITVEGGTLTSIAFNFRFLYK